MGCQVFVEVAQLGEGLITTPHQTDKRSLFRVDPDMIKEVVPLAEHLLAADVVANEYLRPSGSLFIIVPNEPKAFGTGNGDLFVKTCQVDIFSSFYRYFCLWREI